MLVYFEVMKKRDIEYLSKLRDYYAEHRVLPSFSGIARLVGLKSTSAVSAMVDRMKEAGVLESTPERRLQPGKAFFQREVVESAPPGAPPLVGVAAGVVTIDDYLIELPSRTRVLTVDDDSMINAGLLPGDKVVFEKDAPARNGEIVVAMVEGNLFIRYLEHDGNGFYLKAGNENYPPIRTNGSPEIFGVVTGMFRRYRKDNRPHWRSRVFDPPIVP